jgi:hypothetical protein
MMTEEMGATNERRRLLATLYRLRMLNLTHVFSSANC